MRRLTVIAFLAALVLVGCANKPPLPDLKTVEQSSLGFLVTGKTTREDVLLELGPAYRAYEDERIGWNIVTSGMVEVSVPVVARIPPCGSWPGICRNIPPVIPRLWCAICPVPAGQRR